LQQKELDRGAVRFLPFCFSILVRPVESVHWLIFRIR
jgi:hypothetical protein